MIDNEHDTKPDKQMTEEDRAFLEDQSMEEEAELLMYRNMETDAIH